MNIMEKNITYKALMIIADILIAFIIFSIVLSFVVPVILSMTKGAYDTGLHGFSGAVKNIIGFIYRPIQLGTILLILILLRKIFISISGDQPFELRNIIRVRHIGYAMIILGVLRLTVFSTFLLIKEKHFETGIIASNYFINFLQYLFAGFVILVVAEVFRVGAEMYNENKLTV